MSSSPFALCLVALSMAVFPGSASGQAGPPQAGEELYNGIVLPKDWPPRPQEVPADPQTPPYLVSPPSVIPIDVGRQLFVDDFLIEQSTLKRTFHQPEYYPGNPVLRAGLPYSGGVWRDPQDGMFKLWYNRGGLSLAVSRDGIRWDLPTLDVKPGTNVVMPASCHSTAVWLDYDEKDPQKRYKLIYSITFAPPGRCQYWFRFSPDGIHWSDVHSTGADCGDRSTAFYNPFRKVWVFSIRHGWGEPRRRRYWEVRDLEKGPYWDNPAGRRAPMWIGSDSQDPPREDLKITPQLYNLDAVAYESLLLGFFTIWHGQPDYRNKPNDVCVGFSRDGWHWSRPDRRPFCPVSENFDAWNYLNVQSVAGGCLVVGDRLYFYMSGRSSKGSAAGLATLRRDGFASMDAGAQEGTLTTRPVRFEGKHLFVNADASGGEMRAEVVDGEGRVVAPFTRERCVPVRVDRTLQRVSWEGGDDLSALSGKPVKFRFHLKQAKLYAFWVSPDASGASRGYVAAGGPGFTGPTDTEGVAAYDAVHPPSRPGAAPAPEVWPPGGAFVGSVAVSLGLPLHRAEADASVRYTLDGREPTEESPLYTAPLRLTRGTTVKARAWRKGMAPSEAVAADFAIEPDTAPPLRYLGSPSAALAAGTREVTLTLTTSEDALCRYALAPGVSFAEMPHAFAETGGTVHSTPLRGLEDGRAYRFLVKARDLSGNANPDDYEIAFRVAAAERPAPVRVEIEAEDGRLTPPMQTGADEKASGGRYVYSPADNQGTAGYTFSVPATDDYVVWTWVMGPSFSEDSFFVAVDGGMEDIFDVAEKPRTAAWHWAAVNGRDGRVALVRNPRVFPLEKGAHTIVFRSRDHNTRLDRLIITNDPGFSPAGK